MLGLPEGVRACLFDLDGVLTQTAKLHADAWKEMFDGFLGERLAQDVRGNRDGTGDAPDPADTGTGPSHAAPGQGTGAAAFGGLKDGRFGRS